MTDKPDYTKCNPKVLIGNKAIDQVEKHSRKISAPVLRIFNADGTPHPYVQPSHEEVSELLDNVIEYFNEEDIRRVLCMLEQATQAIEDAILRTLSLAHQYAHDEKLTSLFDEETMCNGVHAYLDPEEMSADKEQTGDTSLDRFFISPNTKPN